MKPIYLTLVALPLMTACADSGANYTPILDGPQAPGYQTDLSACQSLARNQRQFDQETIAATVLGAGAGALLGEFDSSDDAAGGAVAGALAGGVASAVNISDRRETMVIKCLRGRGHRIVG